MVRLRSSGPIDPATSRPMMALANTVRHGKRLSFWNTKPRSVPGSLTARLSSSTSPSLACSRPAMMRKNVVLPQPDGPTTEMNSPRSIARLMLRSASRSPNDLLNRETLSFVAMAALILGPGHEARLQPAEACGHDDTGRRQHHDAGEQLGHVEGIRRLTDQPAKASARTEQLRHHHADQAAADADLQAGKYERQRRRQRYLEEDLPRRGAKRAQHLNQPVAGGAQPRFGIDCDRKHDEEDDHQHFRPDADAEPENE